MLKFILVGISFIPLLECEGDCTLARPAVLLKGLATLPATAHKQAMAEYLMVQMFYFDLIYYIAITLGWLGHPARSQCSVSKFEPVDTKTNPF